MNHSMSERSQKEKLSFALSEEYRAEFCRAALEKILAAAAVNESGSSKPALETLPAARRAEFLRFVETGEASQEFLDFVESNEAARAAVEAVFNETAAATERLGALLKSSQPAPSGLPRPGDEMPDGTIYAGVSPDTGKPMYATPADAPTTFTFKKAAQYAKNLDAHGHKDFRVPTKNELNVLYQNRDKGKLKGTFNETGSYPAGWYWSSSQPDGINAWDQRFSDGYQLHGNRGNFSSLRCVR
jgi:Protein of unknown function (DUF1566)